MEKKERGTYVVGIRPTGVNIDNLSVEISGIEGVSGVEFNYLTRKFTIIYDGLQETLAEINEKLLDVTRNTR